ncbi:MAG TPA: hypothetical protein O0X27_04140 [Methanocorpusculum sp.]|nr:hypothetical protein [Methanocorpusculum sp.]
MITPDDLWFWTEYRVPADECARLSKSAEAKLAADGGYCLDDVLQVQLECYLAAGMLESRAGDCRKQSESIGSYSYSKKSTEHTNGWYDSYYELLDLFIARAASPSSTNGGIVHRSADEHIIHLNREFLP